MPELTTLAPVYRHAQDTGTSCGRACAQMVIAALGNGAIVPQSVLQQREHPHDEDVAGGWYTHPDELRNLLAGSPELAMPDWRVASCASAEELVAEIAQALTSGLPAILNLRREDHWAVVSGVVLSAAGSVECLRLLDPLPPPIPGSVLRGGVHSFHDLCSSDADGFADPWPVYQQEFGAYDLVVGDIPPPQGLTDYSGRYVAIVPGRAPEPSLLERSLERIKRLRHPQLPTWRPPSRGQPAPAEVIRAELERLATLIESPVLSRLLASDTLPIARPVHNIESPDEAYTLASLSAEGLDSYVTASIGHKSGRLLHMRMTSAPLITETTPPVLWWTRKPLPTLPSPYYPFVQTTDGGGLVGFVRLFDQVPLVVGGRLG